MYLTIANYKGKCMENKSKNRVSNRHPSFDYTIPSFYFITICINKRKHLLGEIENKEFKCFKNRPDILIETCLKNVVEFYGARLDEFIVMPNHIHFILDTTVTEGINIGKFVKSFKIKSTQLYSQGVKLGLYDEFDHKLRQRDFNDRVVRDEEELYNIRKYIRYNVEKWDFDKNNLKNMK